MFFSQHLAVQPTHDGYRATLVASALLLAVPFIQMGSTYWISVQGFAFLLVLLFVRKNISPQELFLVILISVVMFLSLLGNIHSDWLFHAFLRIIRQILALYLIICAFGTQSWRPKDFFFVVLLPVVILSVSGLVILQFVAYTYFGGADFFVPASFFIPGFGTLADRWIEYGAARGFLTDVRAAGPYSEPSYYGFVALSLAVLVMRGVDSRKWQLILLGVMFVALLCSKSASGVILYGLLLLFFCRHALNISYLIMVLIFGIALLIALEYLMDFKIVDRLINIIDVVKEPSGYVRLVLPWKHIMLVLQEKPFGVPLSEFPAFAGRFVDYYMGGGSGQLGVLSRRLLGTDNGLLNLFITFGFGGFAIVVLIAYVIKDPLILVYLLFSAQFNGDLLSADKAVIVALVVGTCRARVLSPAVNESMHSRFMPISPFGAMLRRPT